MYFGGDTGLAGKYTGHTDAIWDMQVHPMGGKILSASSDGTLILWHIGSAEPLHRKYTALSGRDGRSIDNPTSCAFNPSDLKTFLSCHVSGNVSSANRFSMLICFFLIRETDIYDPIHIQCL